MTGLAPSDPGRLRSVQPSASYLLARLALIEGRVRALVGRRRGEDPAPDDPFRGLYLSDEHIDLILADGVASRVLDWDDAAALRELDEEAAQLEESPAEEGGGIIRLRALARRAGLDVLDTDLLLVALAPDLDARFERLYGYLNDDVTRRRASVALALEMAGTSPWSGEARARLSAEGPLVASGLVVVEDPDRPFLSRSLRVPDRVAAHLLGDDRPDPAVSDLMGPVSPVGHPSPLAARMASLIGEGVALFHLRERAGASAASVAAAALVAAGRPAVVVDLSHLGSADDLAQTARLLRREALLGGGGVGGGPLDVVAGASAASVAAAALVAAGRPAVVVDLGHLGSGDDVAQTARLLRREALLGGGGVVAGPLDVIADRGAHAVRALAAMVARSGRSTPDVPVILYGRAGWEPGWSRLVPVVAEVSPEAAVDRLHMWGTRLGPDAPPDLAASDVTSQFVLSAEQVDRAVTAARLQARLDGRAVSTDHLRSGARAQNGAGLERLARRIHPGVGWDDLVLAPTTAEALRALAARARRRNMVLDEWGMRPGGGRGRGITVLFAGDSGTGKTMSAEVVAGDLGLDLYTVNLATVVDKYVGETEKNLERIFTEADGVNAVLLFDEADAIFGKRSEVKDANDRYANIEVAYLLQRMETFDGIAVLATNLRANVDDAFARRLDMIVDFPAPDVELRRALWDRCLVPALPRGADLDLDFCARSFELSGGNIRSIAITAAYLAADSGRPVGMLDLVRAIQQEYRKLGRLVVAGEFGPYYPLISAG